MQQRQLQRLIRDGIWEKPWGHGLAGDEFAPDTPLALMATGFLGAGVETKADGREKEIGIALGIQYEYRFSQKWGVEGLVELLGRFLARQAKINVLGNDVKTFIGQVSEEEPA